MWKPVFIKNELSRYIINEYGTVVNTKSGRIMKLTADKDGYVIASLVHNKKRYKLKVHRLVALSFIPNPDNKPQVNHKNGNKQKNYVGNLEWATAKENILHAWNTGLKKATHGEYTNGAKYTNEQIYKACRLIDTGKYSDYEIDRLCGFKRGYTYMIKHKRTRLCEINKYEAEKGSTTIERDDSKYYYIDIAV